MPHNAVHRKITQLDALRRELDDERALKSADGIIEAALAGDEELLADALLDQVVPFNNAQDKRRVKAANIGVDLGEEFVKIIGRQ